jgi:hypothetical protein
MRYLYNSPRAVGRMLPINRPHSNVDDAAEGPHVLDHVMASFPSLSLRTVIFVTNVSTCWYKFAIAEIKDPEWFSIPLLVTGKLFGFGFASNRK